MKIISSFRFQDIQAFKFGYLPIGKPKQIVHLYYIDGLLIDTGQQSMQKEILKALSHLNIQQIFITHHHEDHSGNIKAIQKQHQCPAFSSKLTAEIMKNPPPLSLVQRLTFGNRPPYKHLKTIENEIKTPNYSFQLIHIPGHAPDMYALYEPQKKYLFSADLYVNNHIAYFLESESVIQQINSIKKILQLDVEFLFCAHNPQLQNGKNALQKKLFFLETFYEEVATLYHKSYSISSIFKTLQLKENKLIKLLSMGKLSKINMVKAVVRDIQTNNQFKK